MKYHLRMQPLERDSYASAPCLNTVLAWFGFAELPSQMLELAPHVRWTGEPTDLRVWIMTEAYEYFRCYIP